MRLGRDWDGTRTGPGRNWDLGQWNIQVPIYGVYQSHSETSESLVQRAGFIRERIPPIINQKSPWTCVFCHNRSEFINGIGCLFGPYRLSTDPDEEDITVEYKPCIEINKKLFT